MFPYNNMSKIEQLHNGYRLVIDRFSDNAGIPGAEMYRVSTFNDENHYHDEISLTENQWKELKDFILGGADGLISEPFYSDEIEKEFKPRFGGANPQYRDFYRAGWDAAFAYVNKKILDSKI